MTIQVAGMTALAKTCTHFGLRSNNNDDYSFSLIEDIARQILNKEMIDEERAALIRYVDETLISAYQQFLFGSRFGSSLSYIDGDRSRVRQYMGDVRTAICNQVMRGGKHYVIFPVWEGTSVYLGVIRPIKSWNGSRSGYFNPFDNSQFAALHENNNGRWGNSDVNLCMYSVTSV